MIRFSSKLKIGIPLLFLIVFFLILNLTDFSGEMRNFFYLVSSPVQKTLFRTGDSISSFLSGILEIGTFKKEIENLRLDNQELIQEIINLRKMEKENEALREALKIGLEKDFKIEMTYLTQKDVSQDVILIDKGEADGIAEGMSVITPQKVLLGRIGEVYKNFSEVMLITNEKSSFDAKIVGKEIYGAAKGKGGLGLALEFLPKDKEVSLGDFVQTSALGGVYPEGLSVGEVKEVKKSDVEPFQTAEVSPFFNIKKLDILFVIKSF